MEYRKLNSREQTTNVTYRVSFFILLQRVANEKIKIIKSKQRLAIDILTCLKINHEGKLTAHP